MPEHRKVTVEVEGLTFTHIGESVGDFATLCGLDGDDPGVLQRTVPTPNGAKVNCAHCWGIWNICRDWRASDFAKEGMGV